jgi:hypothetical protein
MGFDRISGGTTTPTYLAYASTNSSTDAVRNAAQKINVVGNGQTNQQTSSDGNSTTATPATGAPQNPVTPSDVNTDPGTTAESNTPVNTAVGATGWSVETPGQTTSSNLAGTTSVVAATKISDATVVSLKSELSRVEKLTAQVLGPSTKTPANHAERTEQVQRAYKSLSNNPTAQAEFKAAVLANYKTFGLNYGLDVGDLKVEWTPETLAAQQATYEDYVANKGKTSATTVVPATTPTKTTSANTVEQTGETRTGNAAKAELSQDTLDYLATIAEAETRAPGTLAMQIRSNMQEAGRSKFTPLELQNVTQELAIPPQVLGQLKGYLRGCATVEEAVEVLKNLNASPPAVPFASADTQTAAA